MSISKFLYFDKFKAWDWITIGVYLLITIYIFSIKSIDFQSRFPIFWYSIGTYFFTYFFNYESLRKFNVWLIWFGFSLIHVFIYYRLELDQVDWPSIRGLRNYSVFLIIHQVFRLASLKIQKKEFVALGKSKTDLWDERLIRVTDLVLFPIIVFLIVFLQIV